MRMTDLAPHTNPGGKLVHMANQIGDFFKSYPEDTAVEGIREHIAKFWNRKMRDDFFAYIDANHGNELAPYVAKAVEKLRS
jgi:formate dehydrogenase subunit delta